MTNKDVEAVYMIFNACSWIIGTLCRFSTGLFSPRQTSPTYFQTFFGLHVNRVSYPLAILLVTGSIVFALVSLAKANLALILFSLICISFGISLIYGQSKGKPAFYLPALVTLHVFFQFTLFYLVLHTVFLIVETNENRTWRSQNDPTVEMQLARIFLNQLLILGLCVFGYLSNIIFRDYVHLKSTNKPVLALSSTPSETTAKSDLEAREQHDAGIPPHLYV